MKFKTAIQRNPSTAFAVGLTVLTLALILPPAWFHPLASFDEAWYAGVSRNMLQDGDWWTLKYNGDIFWDKPPIAIWATGVSYRSFGVGEFPSRLFAIACGVATILALYHWGRLQNGPRFGLLVGLLLLGMHDWLRFCAKGQMDVPVTLFVVGHVLLFWKGLDRPWLHLLAGVCLGLGIATKNQVGAFGAIAIVGYILLARDLRPLRQWAFYVSFAVAAVVAAPWFVEQYIEHGRQFLTAYWYMNVTHRQYAQIAGTEADYWFYPRYLISRQTVCAFALVASICWTVWRNGFGDWKKSDLATATPGEDRRRWPMLLLVWIAVVFAACVKLGAVHFWYLLPMYPAAALLIGESIKESRLWRRPMWTLIAVGAWAVVQHAGYYIPPPKELELRATRTMAESVQAATPQDEPVYLANSPPGTRKREIYVPCAHFYFDRVAIEMPDAATFAATIPVGTQATVIGHRGVIENWVTSLGARLTNPGAEYSVLGTQHSVSDTQQSTIDARGQARTTPFVVAPIAESHGFVAVRIGKLSATIANSASDRVLKRR